MNKFDKFNIIKSNNFSREDDFADKIKIYVEMYLLHDNTIFSSSLIHNYLYDQLHNKKKDKKLLLNKISEIFNYGMVCLMRKLKKETLKIYKLRNSNYNLNDFNLVLLNNLNKFISLIDSFIMIDNERFIYNTKKYKLKWGNSELIKIFFNKLCNRLLSDPLIVMMLSDFISSDENVKNLQNFNKFIKASCNYYSNLNIWFENLIKKNISDNIPKNEYLHLIKDKNYILNQNYLLSDLVFYINESMKKYNFISNNELYDTICSEIEIQYKKLVKYFYKEKDNFDDIYNFLINNKELMNIILNQNKDNLIELSILIKNKTNLEDFEDFKKIIKMLNNLYISMTDMHVYVKKKSYFDDLHLLIIKVFDDDKNDEKIIDNLIDYLNIIVNNNLYNKNISYLITSIISIFKNKDLFVKKYEQKLILRILNNYQIYSFEIIKNFIDTENKILKDIYFAGCKNINNINYILDDIVKSNEIKLNFDYWCIDSENEICNELQVIETSFNKWNINVEEGYFDIYKFNKFGFRLDSLLLKGETQEYKDAIDVIVNYTTFFDNKYKKSMLVWYLHLGKIICNFKNFQIIMLPIHKIIIYYLDKENDYNKVIDFLKKITTYNDEFLKNILDSLIKSELYNLSDNKLIPNFNYSSGDIDLIEIYYNISEFEVKIQKKINNELAYDRKMIISSCVNSLLKKEKYYDDNYLEIELLIKKLSESINLFKLNSDVLNESLKYMESRDFIKFDEDKKSIKKLLF